MPGSRTVVAVAVLAASVLSGCSTGKPEEVVTHANYPSYNSSEEIAKAADVVIRGTAITSRNDKMLPDVSTDTDPAVNPQAGLSPEEIADFREEAAVAITVTTVRVGEVLKGDVAVGDVIEVKQLGGELNGVRYRDSTTTLLSAGSTSEYVLLLSSYGPGKPFSLLNPEQAMYTVGSGEDLLPVGEKAAVVDDIPELESAIASQ